MQYICMLDVAGSSMRMASFRGGFTLSAAVLKSSSSSRPSDSDHSAILSQNRSNKVIFRSFLQ